MTPTRLGDVVAVKSGFAFKSADWLDAGVPVIKIANVKDGWVTLDGCSFVSEEVAHSARAFELTRGDVLISMTGHIGQVAKVRDEGRMLLNQRVGRFSIKKRDRINAEYLFQWLRLPEVRAVFEAHAYGAAQPNISPSLIEQQSIPLPSLPVQRRIASILSAYDDLIENNTRRIAILEEMARRIYEEWFVRLRFPGHEGVRMVESELGLVPHGWNVAPLGNVAKLLSGFAFKSTTFVEDGDFGLVTIKNVHDGSFIENCSSRLSRPPENMPTHCALKVTDILLSLTGNVGRCCLVTVDGCLLNQRVAKIQPVKAFDWAYSYLMFRSSELKVRLEAIANGVAQQNLSPIETQRILVVLPPEELRQRFANATTDLLRLALTLQRSNANLRTTRDLLLPRLISGELSVSTLSAPEALAA